MGDKQEWVAMSNTFETILKTVCPEDFPKELRDVKNWLKRVFEYNVPFGKRNRGLFVVSTYKLLNKYNNNILDEKNVELSRILGWTVEILQAYFLVVDDMIDQSVTRRGNKCWYQNEDVGLMANNDAILIDQENYRILKTFFSDKPYYQNIVDLMHEITRLTAYGQCLDVMSNPPNRRPMFEIFTQERYDAIIKYKTALYSFVLPVRLALYMSHNNDEIDHQLAEAILLKIGHLFQIQDDYLDLYGDPTIIGKIGRDIEEGKCSYLAMKAFELSNETQKQVLKDNLGREDSGAVRKVKDVYKQLKLEKVYAEEEERLYRDICKSIDDLVKKDTKLTSDIFYEILNKIYKRVK